MQPRPCFTPAKQVKASVNLLSILTADLSFEYMDIKTSRKRPCGILIDRFGPRVGHLNHLAVPGVGIFEVLFVPVTTTHFTRWEIQLYLTSHVCPGVGNLTAIFWRRLDIDRCISTIRFASG